jgi:hypothetical protein
MHQESSFSKFHRILNRTEWSLLQAAEILFSMLVQLALSYGMLVIVVDETLERRKGKKINAKGVYRDAVRSTKSYVVKAFGLKWLVMTVLVRLPFANRTFALPFFSVLEPSEKASKARNRRHRTCIDWTCIMIRQIRRWNRNLSFTLVGDGGFACGRLAWFCLKHSVTLVSRLKINAALYGFPPVTQGPKRGRPRLKGVRLTGFGGMLKTSNLPWVDAEVRGYGGEIVKVRYLTDTAMWGADGVLPVPIRWILVLDPLGKLLPLPLMCTNVNLCPKKIIELYIDRWSIEVTFEETREYLGVETQRQWSDAAITRTTPILMALYSLVCLMACNFHKESPLIRQSTAWYEKKASTFADCLMVVRRSIWGSGLFFGKAQKTPSLNIPSHGGVCLEALMDYLAATA